MGRRQVPIEFLSMGHHVTSAFALIGEINEFRRDLIEDRKPCQIISVATNDDWEVIAEAIRRYISFDLSGVMDLADEAVLNDRQFRALHDRLEKLPQQIIEAARSLGEEHGFENLRTSMHSIAAIASHAVSYRLHELVVEKRLVLFVPHETPLDC